MKPKDDVQFKVPYFESYFTYRGVILSIDGQYATVEYYEPLHDISLITHIELSRLEKITVY